MASMTFSSWEFPNKDPTMPPHYHRSPAQSRDHHKMCARDPRTYEQILEEARRKHRLGEFGDIPKVCLKDLRTPEVLQQMDQQIPKILVSASVPREVAERLLCFPFSIAGRSLLVAMVDPTDQSATRELRSLSGYWVETLLASEEDIREAIERYYGILEQTD